MLVDLNELRAMVMDFHMSEQIESLRSDYGDLTILREGEVNDYLEFIPDRFR